MTLQARKHIQMRSTVIGASILCSAWMPVLVADVNVTGIQQYWYTQEKLDSLADPKPQLTPQCEGVFFRPTSNEDSQTTDKPENNTNKAEVDNNLQTVTANKVLYSPDGTSIFEGNVIVTKGSQSISGDTMRFNHGSSELQIEGNVQIDNQGLLISSDQASYNSSEESSTLFDAQFLMFDTGLTGTAQRIQVSKSTTHVEHNTVSSCPPGRESWMLKSSKLHMDQEKGWGYARNTSLHLKSVPVLYAPYFTFPLDDRRKSGFLYPAISSDSVNGTDISLPYYFNIAPNYDATLTPRVLSKRGNQMGAEFRYLNITGEGSFSGAYLGQDEINPLYSERKQGQWHHNKRFSPDWYADADYYYVSDDDYFDDIDSFSALNNLGYLNNNAKLAYAGDFAYFSIIAQDFEVLDPTVTDIEAPYRLAPRINAGLSHAFLNSHVGLALDMEFSQFERNLDPVSIGPLAISEGALTVGKRLVLQPTLSLPFKGSGYFFIPEARLHHREYELDDYLAIDNSDDFSFDIPIYSLDSGLIFEREINMFGTQYQQTLEPRIKASYIPFEDQSASPDFDSSLFSLNENQVFNERRYSGNDLVGDTRQVALGVASRFFDEQGKEALIFSMGQIAYLEDRQIQLEPTEDTTTELSPMYGSAEIKVIPNWNFSQRIQWDSQHNQIEQFASGIFYSNKARKIANLEFRYRPDDSPYPAKETHTSLVWPLNYRWKAMSFWNYDIEEQSTIELSSGLEYENCCIIVRALNQKWLRKVSSSTDYESANKQSVEIQLKGLGKLNNEISDYLSQKIPGFNQ